MDNKHYTKDSSPALPYLIDIEPSECIILCAEPGMGKTSVLSRAVIQLLQENKAAMYYDMESLGFNEMLSLMRKAARKGAFTLENSTTGGCILVFDNVWAVDESDADKIAGIVRRVLSLGLSVVLALVPEYEIVVDCLPEARCLWSRDLCITAKVDERTYPRFEAYSHGIAALVDALQRIDVRKPADVFTNVGYQEAYVGCVLACVRAQMMREEQKLRIAMLLLGYGELKDLTELFGEVDDDLWHSLARDAVFLGIDAVHGKFGCVGCETDDCFNLAYSTLSCMVEEWKDVVVEVSRLLVRKGRIARAALVGSICPDYDERLALLLESGPQFINAGELCIVQEAFDDAATKGSLSIPGYAETACTLASIAETASDGLDPNMLNFDMSAERGSLATMAMWCRGLHRGDGLMEENVPFGVREGALGALSIHGRMVRLLAACRLEDAYRMLLDTVTRLTEGSVTSAMAQMDYMLCSLLTGVVPRSLDVEVQRAHSLFLERSGFGRMEVAYDAAMTSCRLLCGRTTAFDQGEIYVHRADRAGDTFVHALLLLVLGIADLRVGALTRAHIRLAQSLQELAALGARPLAKAVRLIDLSLLVELGERVLMPDVQSCRGEHEDVDKVVTILNAALFSRNRKRCVGSGRWGALDCPKNVLWLVNVLMNDCGSVSKRFRSVMPQKWQDSVAKTTMEVDEFFDGEPASAASPLYARAGEELPLDGNAPADLRPIRVSMLGGFSVEVCGNPVSGTRLEKRRAKALLALLSAIPSHKAKRFVIMESVWPTHDYESANKCLYCSTSVLRKELGTLLREEAGLESPLVLTNRSEGSISLNGEVFSCDVDDFENKARSVLDREGQDRWVVTTCREVEEMYKGDLFIPPTDGMGVVESRSRELRSLFADAMAAGATAASKLDMRSLACRFAHKAHSADNMREDTFKVLVTALCASGRHAEAERCYDQFVGRIVDHTKRPPSRQLRAFVEELIKGGVRRTGAGGRGWEIAQGNDALGQMKIDFGGENREDEPNNG